MTTGNLAKIAKLARHWVWIAPIVLGIGFIAGGGYMVVEGRSAHNDVRDTIVQEDITVSADAPAFGGDVIDSAGKAQAQSDAILGHTLAATGGKLYAQLDQYNAAAGGTTNDKTLAAKDANGNLIANPLRSTALTSAELRTSLGVAVMGFKVADLVVGLGAFLIFMGLMNVFIMSPVTYWATVTADEHEKNRVKPTASEALKGTPQIT